MGGLPARCPPGFPPGHDGHFLFHQCLKGGYCRPLSQALHKQEHMAGAAVLCLPVLSTGHLGSSLPELSATLPCHRDHHWQPGVPCEF